MGQTMILKYTDHLVNTKEKMNRNSCRAYGTNLRKAL